MSETELKKIRIDHIGSLVRPATLKNIFARFDRGQASRDELTKAQDQAIRDVIHKQEAHGLPVVTDGEFRRHSFQESFSECVTGFDLPQNISLYYEKRDANENPFERAEQNFNAAGPAIVTRRGAVERLKLMRNLPLEEFRYAQSVAKVQPRLPCSGRIGSLNVSNGKHPRTFIKTSMISSTTWLRSNGRSSQSSWKRAASTSKSTRRDTPRTSIKFR
jgi:methionine synthase II (cobalamin-independent)